jgi:hypothetical protein
LSPGDDTKRSGRRALVLTIGADAGSGRPVMNHDPRRAGPELAGDVVSTRRGARCGGEGEQGDGGKDRRAHGVVSCRSSTFAWTTPDGKPGFTDENIGNAWRPRIGAAACQFRFPDIA